jgi:P-type Mg2+ transporter
VAWRSAPSALLAWTTLAVAVLAVALPFIAPAAHLFGFVALPLSLVATLMAIVLAYIVTTEAAKHWFWRTRAR